MSRLDEHSIKAQFKGVLSSNLLDDKDTSFIFYDFGILKDKMDQVSKVFGSNVSHTIAVKSNPLTKVLMFITRNGFGLECASFEEVLLAQNAGANIIAWDSPVKTRIEIEASNEVEGLIINANGLGELRTILELNTKAQVFLRINPMTETGSHSSMSVSGKSSKFGESLLNKKEIVEAIVEANGRVSGLHVHSSSQTSAFDRMTEAIASVIDLADEINDQRSGTINTIDIGGGFPVEYSNEDSFNIEDYAAQLKTSCPRLFNGTYHLVSEFGRFYHGNAGWTASRIQEVKQFDEKQVLIIHVGADLLLREAYNPSVWHHDFITLQNDSTTTNTDIGGPLCFGGDYIARDVELPQVQSGDWIIIRDTGANSFALWSKHCSRSFPKVVGFEEDNRVIRERDSFTDLLKFWG